MTSPTATMCPLEETAARFPTDVWNDSCSIAELTYAIERGAVGATSNPVIVSTVLEQELPKWAPRIGELIEANPQSTEDEITWMVIEEMALKAAALLDPVFDRTGGRKGWLSLQTNPKFYRSAPRLVEQAARFRTLARNIQVKVPATSAGIPAIEEATYRGVNINATVSFTAPQAVAVAEAIERALRRREAEGLSVDGFSPVCTLMVGRLDDWLRVLAARDAICVDPGVLNWAGVAVMKNAYRVFQERGYRTRLLAAAYRCHMHWSEFIGGDVVLTIPHEWQRLFNGSDVEVTARMDRAVDPQILNSLTKHFPDFRRAYEPDGLTAAEFDTFGPTARTLRQFLSGYESLVKTIRDRMVPDPDKKR